MAHKHTLHPFLSILVRFMCLELGTPMFYRFLHALLFFIGNQQVSDHFESLQTFVCDFGHFESFQTFLLESVLFVHFCQIWPNFAKFGQF